MEEAGVRYQIVGGLAARAHGATRSLADIDLYVPRAGLALLVPHVQPWLVQPPRHHRGDEWDLEYMVLEREGQRFEIAAAEGAHWFDRKAGAWVDAGIDFDASVMMGVEGVRLPVMRKHRLVDYKRRLGRDVDRADLEELDREG